MNISTMIRAWIEDGVADRLGVEQMQEERTNGGSVSGAVKALGRQVEASMPEGEEENPEEEVVPDG